MAAPKGKAISEKTAQAILDEPITLTQRQIAEKYGVSQSTVAHIRRGAAWKHLRKSPPSPHSKVTPPETAQAILDAPLSLSYRQIADKFGVSETTVYNIRRRITWKHLKPKRYPLPSS